MESQQRLVNHEKKIRILDKLTDVALQSLTHYFDQRMEHLRHAIKEHCDAIQQLLDEENEHWNEIHTAIDQNLITSDDIHRCNNLDKTSPLTNIHTIDEVDEDKHTSKLINSQTITPLLTQMIRKSRLQSNRHSNNESKIHLPNDNFIQTKEERLSVILPLTSARRTLPIIDTTYVVKIEESQNIEENKSYQVNGTPIESLSSTNVEIIQSYSPPKTPARLYFSPRLLQDNEETEPIQYVLTAIDQNQTNIEKMKPSLRRFGQTFLLNNIQTQDMNKVQDEENLRPKISDEIPLVTHPCSSISILKPIVDETYHQKPLVYSRRQRRARSAEKNSEPIRMTLRQKRNKKQTKEIDTIKPKTRKRKKSITDDENNKIVALRKKKSNDPARKINTRKTRVKKSKELPVREPSPLPIIDRSKHYCTRFSTRSHRLNNTTTLIDDDKNKSTRTRTKSARKIIDSKENDRTTSKTRLRSDKTQSNKRSKSMMVTRHRKK